LYVCVFFVVTDLSHSETRLSVYLDNFELHVYNRTAVYSNLEKLFGIDELLPQPSESAPPELALLFWAVVIRYSDNVSLVYWCAQVIRLLQSYKCMLLK